MSDNAYITFSHDSSSQITEKKSVFIGYARSVESEEEAVGFLNEIRKKNTGARHNVFAYLLRSGAVRASDDGEPQGSGGIPVLGVIKKSSCVNAAIVVTRYFGGILLGAPGLVRAYTAAAVAAAGAAGRTEYVRYITVRLTMSYQDYNRAVPLFRSSDVITDASDFRDAVTLTLAVRDMALPGLVSRITEMTGAGAVFETVGEGFRPLHE